MASKGKGVVTLNEYTPSAPVNAQPHKFGSKAKGAQSFGHAAHVRSGHLRNSGAKGAHRVGKR